MKMSGNSACEQFPMIVAEILYRFNYDLSFLKLVANVYLSDYHTHLAELKDRIDHLDCIGIEQAAHKLKGAAGNFTSSVVTATAAEIQGLAREGKLKEVNSLFDRLLAEAEKLDSDLQKILGAQSEGSRL